MQFSEIKIDHILYIIISDSIFLASAGLVRQTAYNVGRVPTQPEMGAGVSMAAPA